MCRRPRISLILPRLGRQNLHRGFVSTPQARSWCLHREGDSPQATTRRLSRPHPKRKHGAELVREDKKRKMHCLGHGLLGPKYTGKPKRASLLKMGTVPGNAHLTPYKRDDADKPCNSPLVCELEHDSTRIPWPPLDSQSGKAKSRVLCRDH